MPTPETTADLRQRIDAALEFAAPPEGREAMRVQNIWLIREMMKRVKPEHLTDDEIAVVVSALAPAHGRVLLECGGVSNPAISGALAKVLTLVHSDDPAPQLGDEATNLSS